MTLVDANVLLYAMNALSPRHRAASAWLDAWRARPNVVHPEPSRTLSSTFVQTLSTARALGNLVNDAYLAAVAIEYGATVATIDRDFGRFPGVAQHRPLPRGHDRGSRLRHDTSPA